jgi:uncharacterized protein
MLRAPQDPPPRQARAHAAFQLWLVNVLIGTLVGSAWLFRLPEDLSAWTRVYVGVALFSSVAVLALVPGLLFVGVHYGLKQRWRLAGFLQAALGAHFLGLLYTDTIVYRLLRYHFNGAVLNVALTRGSEDAVHLGWGVWGTVLVYLVVATAVQYQIWRAALGFTLRRKQAQRRLPLLLQPRVVVLAVLLPAIGLEKSLYAAADIQGDQEMLWAAKPLPIYPKVRVGRLLDPGGQRLPQLEILPEEATLNYPLASPVVPGDGPRPSFFLLVLDSWRKDMFTPELTPRLHAFAEGARVFTDHLAGGNGTRFGLFTMLYGLHGSYWFKVLGAFKSPVLLDTLQDAGYDVRVFSAASQNFPEFLPTAWVGLPREHVVDEFLDQNGRPRSNISYVKDGFVADAVESWLEQRRVDGDERPFFCFVLLDAPHQPYYNPGGPYQPTVEHLNYIELGRTTEGPALDSLIEKVLNTYKNSVVCADTTAGRLLDALESADELERTVVMVTGDHGEEFQENGYWGHTSNFSPEQVAVPFYLKGPGIEAGEESRPTSHLDISNSLLELCGVDPAQRGDYSLGESLFDPPAERARVVAGWSDIGIWTASGIFDLPLDAESEEIEVYDERWRRLTDVQERCAAEEPVLLRIAEECVRFLTR